MKYQIAFYIRVSTEEQAKNLEGSIKNQKERLLQTVKLKNMDSDFGEVVGIYIDRAKSGKDTNRPELQKMLMDIQAGRVNLVMASELSRISRSIKDFSEIWEMMKQNKCDFLSLRENFDTTTAAGEMVLYTVANIAQFERRQVSERVSANIKARSERGLYNGGSVILGYKTDPEKTGYLLIDEVTKETVIQAFDGFLREGTLATTARWLNDNGYKPRRGHFNTDNLHKILINKTYIGIKSYLDGSQKKEVKAVWEPIIERNIFDRVQVMLKKNHRRKKPHQKERYPYLFSGLTYCKTCGDVLCGKSAHGNGGKIGYYEHSWATRKESCLSKKTFDCRPHRVLAKKLEPVVLNQVMSFITDKNFAEDILKRAQEKYSERKHNDESKKIRGRISAVDGHLEALAERLGGLPKTVSAVPIFKQMEKLQIRKEELEKILIGVEDGFYPRDVPVEFENLQKITEGMKKILESEGNFELKSKIIQKLVHRVEVGIDSVVIHFIVGKKNLLSCSNFGSNSLTIIYLEFLCSMYHSQ